MGTAARSGKTVQRPVGQGDGGAPEKPVAVSVLTRGL